MDVSWNCNDHTIGLLNSRVFFLALGNLRNGGNAGLSYLNANNGLGNANWNILSLISDLSNKFRSRTSVG